MGTFKDLVKGTIDKWSVKEGKLSVEWRTGGVTGGNCWGDHADRAVESEREPEFEGLDEILAKLCPQISFLQYKVLCKNVVKYSEKQESEYYGNYYDYSVKSVDLAELEKYLKRHDLWEDVS